MGDIGVRFHGADPPYTTLPVVLEGDHVLDVEFGAGLRIRTVTVVDSTRRLPPASALGRQGAYRLVSDADNDMMCIEFRSGAATRGGHTRDTVDVNGEDVLHLLWGPAEELEGIVIRNASRRLPRPSPPGLYPVPQSDALLLRLFAGEDAPVTMRIGETAFPSGMRVLLSLDAEGRLWSVTVLEASRWVSPDTLGQRSVDLGVLPVQDVPNAVFLEVAGGRAEELDATERLLVEGLEIRAAYDSYNRLLGFIISQASRKLPPPFDQAGRAHNGTTE